MTGKRVLLVLISFFLIPIVFADTPNKSCFYSKATIPSTSMDLGRVYKIVSDKNPLLILQDDEPLSYKNFIPMKKPFSYTLKEYTGRYDIFLDNQKTSFKLDTTLQRSLLLQFDKKINKAFLYFDFSSQNYIPKYFIRIGGFFEEVTLRALSDFEFSELEIRFVPRDESKPLAEKVEIFELQIYSLDYATLLKSNSSGGDIHLFSDYICSDPYDFSVFNKGNFTLDIGTPLLDITFGDNPFDIPVPYNDKDKDMVADEEDNCKDVYNKDQKDSNADGVGDICADDDGDGYIGWKDNCVYISNRDQKDINQNKIGDVCEFDKDKDGVFDVLDNCMTLSNPDQKDSDKDGIGDLCDNCEAYNPTQIDTNMNAIGDVCEENKKKLEENDKDADGLLDYVDNCEHIVNPDQRDSDNDGVGDLCDNCQEIQNSYQEDIDRDGIGDTCEDSDNDSYLGYLDNCIYISNPDQKDTDNNGVGDMCEDSDFDAILQVNDNCPFVYNIDQKDTDKDGIGDVCDLKDNRFMESNKWFFIGILIFISLLFAGGIVSMLKKVKNF